MSPLFRRLLPVFIKGKLKAHGMLFQHLRLQTQIAIIFQMNITVSVCSVEKIIQSLFRTGKKDAPLRRSFLLPFHISPVQPGLLPGQCITARQIVLPVHAYLPIPEPYHSGTDPTFFIPAAALSRPPFPAVFIIPAGASACQLVTVQPSAEL